MPLDGVFIKGLTRELSEKLVGAKIEKIQQPARGSIVMTLKREQRMDLFIGGSTGASRMHITCENYEKPMEPPMFCMLLRKHLVGARVLSVEQQGFERVVTLNLAAPGMFGEGEKRNLIVELLGRTANVILTDGQGIITDCLYRIGSAGEKRMILPGMYYAMPPAQEKLDFTVMNEDGLCKALSASYEKSLEKALVKTFLGISPLAARELIWCAYGDTGLRTDEAASADNFHMISSTMLNLSGIIKNDELKPYLLYDPQGEPFEFSYMPVLQYGPSYRLAEKDSFSELLESFCGERDEKERRRQRSRELTKSVQTIRDRVARRIAAQEQELAETQNREYLRECGDIITSNLYSMKKGMTKLVAFDYYSDKGDQREIDLDPLKTPQQNAAKYYKDYSRAKSAQKHLTELIESGKMELDYLDSVLDELARAENARELSEIRAELVDSGYMRDGKHGKKEKRQALGPMRFKSDTGFIIRVGRNNLENDTLTMKNSAKSDMWLHAQKIHGSHAIISCNGATPDERTINQAAAIAAYYSQGRNSGQVPVDYTLVKYVKKPSGARPGMVIYTDQRTLYVKPDKELIERLRL